MGNIILQISSDYPWAKLYQKLFMYLEEVGISEDVFIFTDKGFKQVEEYPQNVKISKCYNNKDRYIFHIKHLKVLKDIQNKMDIHKYKVIHAHTLFSNGYVAYKLYKKYKIPYIVAVRNTDINVFFKKMIHLRLLGLNILKNAEKIIFVSEPYKELTIKKYVSRKYQEEILNKSIVIPNGIDQFWHINKAGKRKVENKNNINLIYVGTLDSNKNIETTIKSCKMLIEKGYKVNYKMIGRITNDKYRDFIKDYSFIEYISHCDKEKLISYYRSSDIFVMPSKHETFGLVYAEAMSQGLPVIYTRGQGFDGQFEEGQVGYSVQYDNAEEMTDRIIKIVGNYEQISNNCIEKVDRFDWGKIAKEYLEIYNEVLGIKLI